MRNNKIRDIAAFDFDVTITTKDTFVPYLVRAFGLYRVGKAFLDLAPEAVKVASGLSDRDIYKERLVRSLFMGQRVESHHNLGVAHAASILNLVRPSARKRIEWHRERGDRLVMVSASLDVYLEPVAKELGFDDLLCTRLSSNKLVFDGGLVGKNCRGPEKVRRLCELAGDLSSNILYGYGDSVGDRELLAAANHAYFRAFEPGGELF